MNLKTACNLLLVASIIDLASTLLSITEGLNEGWLTFDEPKYLFQWITNLLIPIMLIFVSSSLANQQTQISKDISAIRNMLK